MLVVTFYFYDPKWSEELGIEALEVLCKKDSVDYWDSSTTNEYVSISVVASTLGIRSDRILAIGDRLSAALVPNKGWDFRVDVEDYPIPEED